MKTSLLSLLSALVLACGLALGSAGCAGSSTQASTGEMIDDAAITAKVKTALARNEAVSALDVQVETFKSTVQLSGFVDNAQQKEIAADVARAIAGVAEVKNNITVKSTQQQ